MFVGRLLSLREGGFDIEDPTAETLEIWMTDFKEGLDWDDPETMEAFEDCSSGSSGGNDSKGGDGK
jgi:hypothetical protein